MSPAGVTKAIFASRAFAEPYVAVWPRRDECRIAQARGPEVADAAARSDASDFAAIGKSEPEIPVRAHRNVKRLRSLPDREGSEECLGGNVSTGECEQSGDAEAECEETFTPNGWRTRLRLDWVALNVFSRERNKYLRACYCKER